MCICTSGNGCLQAMPPEEIKLLRASMEKGDLMVQKRKVLGVPLLKTQKALYK